MAIKASDTITVVRIADGTSVTITSTSVEYQKSSSGTATPSTWQSTIPDVPAGQYLWTKTTVYYSNGKSTVSYSVAKQGSTGAAGKGIKSTAITYAKSSSNTTAPSSGWQSSVPATDATNKYLWTRTIITYTDNTTSTSYTVGSTMDGLIVGGRNLLINSNFSRGTFYPVCIESCKIAVNNDSTYGHVLNISGTVGCRIFWMLNNVWVSGNVYSISFVAKSTVDGQIIRPSRSIADFGNDIMLTTEYRRYTATIMCTSTVDGGTLSLSFGNTKGDVSITNVKLEKGNVATDWTPAPEDAVATVKQQYYLSTSTTSATGGTWSDTIPELKENTCIWTRTATIYGSGDITYSTPILDSVTKKVVQTAADIKQTNTDLTLVASRTSTLESGMTDAKKRLDAAEASIKVNADAIELKVSKNGIVSAINQTSESIKIQASKISLEGLTTINNLFKVKTDGSIEATNATISGNITASSGTIGGWKIGPTTLISTNTEGNVACIANGSGDSQDVLWVRTGAGTASDPYKWPIILRATGQAVFNNATITGGIHATSAIIDGEIKMKDIGGSTVTVLCAGVSVDDPHSLWINPWGEIDTVRISGGYVEVGGDFNVSGAADIGSDMSVTGTVSISAHSTSWTSVLQGNAAINMPDMGNTNGFNGLTRIKTKDGAWAIGALNSDSGFRVVYGNNARLNSGTNGYEALYTFNTSGCLSANRFQIWNNNADEAWFNAVNSLRSGRFLVSSTGRLGIFDSTNSRWMLCSETNGTTKFDYRTEMADLYSKDYSGTLRKPTSSASGSGNQVAYFSSRSGGTLAIVGQYGATTLTTRTIDTSSSDIRLKTDIKPSTISGLGLLRRIQMKQFDWIDTGKHQCIGFIADELEQLDPKLSLGGGYDDDGNMDVKTVNVFYLMGYAVKSIQELDTETVVQKDRIRTLESQLDTMRVILEQAFERIAKLEKQL